MAKENGKSMWINVLFSLVGVLVGATVQYYATLSTQKSQLWSQLRTQAYGQYIENNAKLGILERQEPRDELKIGEANALKNSAWFLIALYGTKRVVKAIGDYLLVEGGANTSEEFKRGSTELFAAMRQDLLPADQQVKDEFLRFVLFTERAAQ
jgi:hypothetical protein